MENEKDNAQTKQGVDMEPINDFDQNHFYESNSIDSASFEESNRSEEDLAYQEISGTATVSERLESEAETEKSTTPKKTDVQPDSSPTEADGKRLMDVGRAPDS